MRRRAVLIGVMVYAISLCVLPREVKANAYGILTVPRYEIIAYLEEEQDLNFSLNDRSDENGDLRVSISYEQLQAITGKQGKDIETIYLRVFISSSKAKNKEQIDIEHILQVGKNSFIAQNVF